MVESANVSLTQGSEVNMMPLDRSWFIQSRRGNIKDQYFFEKKLGSGGYGAVYLALNKQTGNLAPHIISSHSAIAAFIPFLKCLNECFYLFL